MPLVTTAGAPPAFLSKNYINGDAENNGGVFTASTNQAILSRIYDMDPYSFWASLGSTDGDTQTIVVELFEGAAQLPRDIDFLALLNINLLRFRVEYSSDGVAWTTVPGADFLSSDFTGGADFVLVLGASINAAFLRVTMTHTTPVLQDKRIGTFVAALFDHQMAQAFEKYEKRFREKVRKLELGDGTIDVTYIKRSAVSYEYFGATLFFSNVTTAERDVLRRIKREGNTFLFYPEPGDAKRDIFMCLFDGVWSDQYTGGFKGAGYDIGFSVIEVSNG